MEVFASQRGINNIMGFYCVIITTVLYSITCTSCYLQKDHSHAIMWLGYTIANIGLLWYESTKLGS